MTALDIEAEEPEVFDPHRVDFQATAPRTGLYPEVVTTGGPYAGDVFPPSYGSAVAPLGAAQPKRPAYRTGSSLLFYRIISFLPP